LQPLHPISRAIDPDQGIAKNMAAFCPHCSRANTPEARYCHFDGVPLSGASRGPLDLAHQPFASPFVFRTGLNCRNFEEFAQGCQQNWNETKELLVQGHLRAFFTGMGRNDLAHAADVAAQSPDRDRGVDQFLSKLPGTSLSAPRLEVIPAQIDLGTQRIGQDQRFELQLVNRGQRLVQGSVSANVPWLLPEGASAGVRLFQFTDSMRLPVIVVGSQLRAVPKTLDGHLVIESNGETVTVKVQAAVPVQPFTEGVLAGAQSLRELAEKAKKQPREAAPLFESGQVQRWYHANGWPWPIHGPLATGFGAVQQYFEALGLSKVPQVRLSSTKIELRGLPGAKLSASLHVTSAENRIVFAVGTSTDGWIQARPALLKGNDATLPVEITVPNHPGRSVNGTLRVWSNGGKQFDVQVVIAVEGTAPVVAPTKKPATASTMELAPVALTEAVDDKRKERRKAVAPPLSPAVPMPWKHLAPLMVLVVVALGFVVKDAASDLPKRQQVAIHDEPIEEKKESAEPKFQFVIQDEPDEAPKAPPARFKIDDEPEERFGKAAEKAQGVKFEIKDEPPENAGGGAAVEIEKTPLVRFQVSPQQEFGLSTVERKGQGKRLTFSPDGGSNNTVLSVNGGTALIENQQFVRFLRSQGTIDAAPPTPGAGQSQQATFSCGTVTLHQILEVVPGQPVVVGGVSRRLLDTMLVRWVFHNNAKVAQKAGLRFQLDTMIGFNDGVPFTVPGRPGLVNSFADFTKPADVPDFLQALENPNLNSPGTIAHLTAKVGGGVEPPGRLTLTHWSGFSDSSWNIPVSNLSGDSAVVLYWPEKSIKPGEKRTIGFAYGLGNVVSSNDKLGLTLGGSFEPGQAFTATAYVENPIPGQTLRLELPDGLTRVDGAETQNVPPAQKGAGRDTSVVTWKIRVERTGEFKLKVHSSTGLTQAKTITISRNDLMVAKTGKLKVDLVGSFDPGQIFHVIGVVGDPVEGQDLTLHLPTQGLQLVEGAEKQKLAFAPEQKETQVQWKVRVVQPGKYAIRVASSTGIAQTKTITIEQPVALAGNFQMKLAGSFEPGKQFEVVATIPDPAPDQTLTLELPAGLSSAEANAARKVPATNNAELRWPVQVGETGKFSVRVVSSTGIAQKKTVTIEPPADQAGRFNFNLTGDIRPGKEIQVSAEVTNPVAGQTLSLVLPKGIEALTTDRQTVPATMNGRSTVQWTVRILETGRHPVRVESSTGLARTKTINLSENKDTLFK
jgi:hypothetical protein